MTITNQCNWCSDELAAEILDQSTVMEVAAGEVIMNPGDTVEGAYILEQGAVKLFRICESGNRHLLYLLFLSRCKHFMYVHIYTRIHLVMVLNTDALWRAQTHTHTHKYEYINMACVCLCEKDSKRVDALSQCLVH